MSDDEPESITFEDQSTPDDPVRPAQDCFALQLGDHLLLIEHGSVAAVEKVHLRRVGDSELGNLLIHLKSGQTLTFGPLTPREMEPAITLIFQHAQPVDIEAATDYTEASS